MPNFFFTCNRKLRYFFRPIKMVYHTRSWWYNFVGCVCCIHLHFRVSLPRILMNFFILPPGSGGDDQSDVGRSKHRGAPARITWNRHRNDARFHRLGIHVSREQRKNTYALRETTARTRGASESWYQSGTHEIFILYQLLPPTTFYFILVLSQALH